MIGGELQQRRPLGSRIAAPAECLLKLRGHLGRGEIAVARRDDQRRARDDAQDLADALARLHHRDAARHQVRVIGNAQPADRKGRVALGGRKAGARGLHLGDEVDEVSTVCGCSCNPIACVSASASPA